MLGLMFCKTLIHKRDLSIYDTPNDRNAFKWWLRAGSGLLGGENFPFNIYLKKYSFIKEGG